MSLYFCRLYTTLDTKNLCLITHTLPFLIYFSHLFVLDFTYSVAGRCHLSVCIFTEFSLFHSLVKLQQLMTFDSLSL